METLRTVVSILLIFPVNVLVKVPHFATFKALPQAWHCSVVHWTYLAATVLRVALSEVPLPSAMVETDRSWAGLLPRLPASQRCPALVFSCGHIMRLLGCLSIT